MNVNRLIELLYDGINSTGGGNDVGREATRDAVQIIIDALEQLDGEDDCDGY